MLFDEQYHTIALPAEGVFSVKGSRFMAYAIPIDNEEEAKQAIFRIKKQHPKARHHCWAYRLLSDGSHFKVNDDGEPAGTAGKPIFNTLLSAKLTHVLLIIVRYFGGTLLGIPGLIHAYKQAAIEAITHAHCITLTLHEVVEITYPYEQLHRLMLVLKRRESVLLSQQEQVTCVMQVAIRKLVVNALLTELKAIPHLSVEVIGTRALQR